MRISLLQYDIQWMDAAANISKIEAHLSSLETPIDLLVLPEMYLTGFNMKASETAMAEDDPAILSMISLAREYNIAIIGSLAIKDQGKYCNRVLLIDGDGIQHRYDKQYLYSPSGENKAYTSIIEPNIFEYNGWKILPQVCYDLRFPENVRQIDTADLIVYMANWPAGRITHWDALLTARAIENQAWVIGCNRIGTDGNEWEYPGHTRYVKPDGKILTLGSNESSFELDLPLEVVEKYRSTYKFQEDRNKVIVSKSHSKSQAIG